MVSKKNNLQKKTNIGIELFSQNVHKKYAIQKFSRQYRCQKTIMVFIKLLPDTSSGLSSFKRQHKTRVDTWKAERSIMFKHRLVDEWMRQGDNASWAKGKEVLMCNRWPKTLEKNTSK